MFVDNSNLFRGARHVEDKVSGERWEDFTTRVNNKHVARYLVSSRTPAKCLVLLSTNKGGVAGGGEVKDNSPICKAWEEAG